MDLADVLAVDRFSGDAERLGALGDLATFTYKKFDPLTVATMLREAAGKPNEKAKDLVREWASKFDESVTVRVLA